MKMSSSDASRIAYDVMITKYPYIIRIGWLTGGDYQ